MNKRHNEYESAEIVVIGAAQEIVLGIKDFPSLDGLEWPLFYRTDDWSPFDW
jgi:hypothetical protein